MVDTELKSWIAMHSSIICAVASDNVWIGTAFLALAIAHWIEYKKVTNLTGFGTNNRGPVD